MSDSSDDTSASQPSPPEPVAAPDQHSASDHAATVEPNAAADADSPPSAEPYGPRNANGFEHARWLLQIRLAAAFLTILPIAPARTESTADVAASFGWFPLVGFILGLALCALDWILKPLFGDAMRAVWIVMTLAAITGTLHLDGLADTTDALAAGTDRTRVLDILRDSRIGTFGALALIFVIVLKVFAIAGSAGPQRYAAIYMAPGLSRWAMVALTSGLEYLRAEGAGSAMLARDRRRNLKVATITSVIALIPVVMFHALRACVVAALVTLALRSFYRRWLGGVTGDLIGAAGEIVETAVLIAVTN
jgi:adenosylcobinamide-GDP ribazoletransferase